MNIPSKAYATWHKDAIEQLSGYSQGYVENISTVELSFWAPDKRGTDLTNKAESIMDLLVDKGVLEDDNWWVVPQVNLIFMGVDRTNPRCEILITRKNQLP